MNELELTLIVPMLLVIISRLRGWIGLESVVCVAISVQQRGTIHSHLLVGAHVVLSQLERRITSATARHVA